jgi:hypothetical protein
MRLAFPEPGHQGKASSQFLMVRHPPTVVRCLRDRFLRHVYRVVIILGFVLMGG